MRIGAGRTSRNAVRLLAVIPVLAAVGFVGSATKLGPSVSGCAQASTVHHAALVAEHANGTVVTTCVSFSADSITGEELLALARQQGVESATAAYGSTGQAVCQIDYEPSSYPPGCWTASSPYWAMFVSRGGGAWTFSSRGISSQTFSDGDAEGFRYEGQSDYSTPPSPAGVCPPPATATPIPAVTATPATHSVSRATSRPTAVPPPSSASDASGTPAAPSAAATTSATPAASASAHAVVTGVRAPPSGPASLSAGAWAAVAVGGALLVLLAIQVARGRRRVRATRQPG